MKWIKTEDSMPEFNREVLFYSENKFRIGAFYRHSHRFISDGDKYFKSDVSHWSYIEKPM